MDNRQLIPRWHTSRKAMSLQFPTLQPIKVNSGISQNDKFLRKAREKWAEDRNIGNATELFTGLMIRDIFEDPDGNDSLRFLLQHEKQLPRGTLDLITPKLRHIDKNIKYYSHSPQEVRKIISRLKKIVHQFPNDYMTWSDLGFYYTVLGTTEKAKKCLSIAWGICNGNPYITRSYARFLLHTEQPDQAMWVLRKTGGIGKDPLITSASIAIGNAFNIRGADLTKANKLLSSYNGIRAFSSELAAALGTIEVLNGRTKKARELFTHAMQEPSENSLSQYKWLRHKYDFDMNGQLVDDAVTVEGNVNELYVKGQFSECRDKLLELFSFQPISDAPISDAGYMSLVGLNDPDFVIKLSEGRVPYTHMSFGELNNLVVAKLLKENLTDIDMYLHLLSKKVISKQHESFGVYQATAGMALFKLNNYEKAKEQYQAAIKLFSSKNNPRAVLLAEHYLSLCLKKVDPKKYLELRVGVEKKAKALKMPELLINKVKNSDNK